MPVERSAMLGAQLWVIRWVPREGVTAVDVEANPLRLRWALGDQPAVLLTGLQTEVLQEPVGDFQVRHFQRVVVQP